MKVRTSEILEAAVKEFIATGEPVSSSRLYEAYDFGIKPAMIRAELEALMEEGFLAQPYHSSGRIPSDRGFEFFIDRLLDARTPDRVSAPTHLEELFLEGMWEEFLSAASSEFGVLMALDTHEDDSVRKSGLGRLVSSLSWESQEEIASIINDFEELDSRLRRVEDAFSGEQCPEIFIGRKSPITRDEGLAVVMGKFRTRGHDVCLAAVGTKRMNYPKITRAFKRLKSIEK